MNINIYELFSYLTPIKKYLTISYSVFEQCTPHFGNLCANCCTIVFKLYKFKVLGARNNFRYNTTISRDKRVVTCHVIANCSM